MKREKHYGTDDGNGIKVVGVLILFSLLLFLTGLFAGWVANTFMHPAWSAVSP